MIFERVSQNPFIIKECVSQLRESPGAAAHGVGAELALILDPDTAIPLLLAAFPRYNEIPKTTTFSPQFVTLYRDHVSAAEVEYVGKCRKGMPKVPRTLTSSFTDIENIEAICNDFRRVFSASDITEQQVQRASTSILKLLVSNSYEEENFKVILNTIIFGLSCKSSQSVNESLLAGLVGWNLTTPNSPPWDKFPNLLEPFIRAIICATRNTPSTSIKHQLNYIIQNITI